MPGNLRGNLTHLRPLHSHDLPMLARWDADPEIEQLMGKKFDAQVSPEDWYQRLRTRPQARALAVESADGSLVGEVELEQINWRTGMAEVRIMIGIKELWGKGLGSDALRAVLRLAFDQWGLRVIYLRVFSSNRRAIRCYQRLGFVAKGRLSPSPRRGDQEEVLLMTVTREAFRTRCSNVDTAAPRW